ncbi:hypothetical protein [Streptomyces cadmiisoli]|uniref:hypothetical protein n=1 Tax=Streptomyces cadmiisoli TaxID=2184053 RepID=UPI00365FFDD6
MTSLAQLRKAALALPEVAESAHLGTVAFTVRGHRFAAATKDGRVQLRLPRAETEAALAAHPGSELLLHAGAPVGLRVALADINGKDLNALVRASWFSRAPKRLAATVAEAEAAADRPGGDLPAGIGRPATQALYGVGVRTLEQVARHSAPELLALHGVGPKAVRVLSEELERHGLTLRG